MSTSYAACVVVFVRSRDEETNGRAAHDVQAGSRQAEPPLRGLQAGEKNPDMRDAVVRRGREDRAAEGRRFQLPACASLHALQPPYRGSLGRGQRLLVHK